MREVWDGMKTITGMREVWDGRKTITDCKQRNGSTTDDNEERANNFNFRKTTVVDKSLRPLLRKFTFYCLLNAVIAP